MTDEDDPPSKRETVPNPLAVAHRVARQVGDEFFAAFTAATSGDPKRELRGQLALVVLTIRAGDMPGRDYARLPPHLPDDERSMRHLAVSSTAADASLRADLFAWGRHNRDHAVAAAKALENAVLAYQRGVELAEPDPAVAGHCEIVAAHVKRTWEVDIRMAPEDDRLPAWCRETVATANPTPDWLTTTKQARLFVPGTKEHRPDARNPMASFKAYRDDDD